MPFVIKHPGPVIALTQMAANVGADRTARENLQDNLAVGGYELHQQQVEEGIRARQQAEALQAMQNVMLDNRQRELNQANNAARLGAADLNGQYGLERAQVNVAGQNQRTADQIAAANQRNDANNDTRIQISTDRNAVTQRGQDLQTGLGYDRLQAQQDGAEQRQRERVALETARTAAQMERAQGRLERSAQLAQLHAMISEKQRQRSILEQRARQGDQQAPAYIDQLNAEIKGLVDAIVPPRMGPPSPNPGIPPIPYDAQAPDGRQPAPNMNGLNQQGVSAPAGPVSMGQQAPPILITPDGRKFRVAGHDGQQPVYEAVA